MAKLPRLSANRLCKSINASSQSASKRRATGKNSTPSGVNANVLVERINNFPPTISSKFLMVILNAGCERCTNSQASAKLFNWATATKARICLMVMFIFVTFRHCIITIYLKN